MEHTLGCPPEPDSIIILVRDAYKPSFPLLPGGGTTPKIYTSKIILVGFATGDVWVFMLLLIRQMLDERSLGVSQHYGKQVGMLKYLLGVLSLHIYIS